MAEILYYLAGKLGETWLVGQSMQDFQALQFEQFSSLGRSLLHVSRLVNVA